MMSLPRTYLGVAKDDISIMKSCYNKVNSLEIYIFKNIMQFHLEIFVSDILK